MPSIAFNSLADFEAGVRRALAVADDPAEVRVITPGAIPALEVSDAVADALTGAGPVDADGPGETDDPLPSGDPAPAAPATPPADIAPPRRNASTEAWHDFMTRAYPDLAFDGLDRDELIAKYDEITGGNTAE